jgi:hypothetical protein
MIAFLKCLIFGHRYGRFIRCSNLCCVNTPRLVRFCTHCNKEKFFYPEAQVSYLSSVAADQKSLYYAELFNKENNL